jgi:hypothetical protein
MFYLQVIDNKLRWFTSFHLFQYSLVLNASETFISFFKTGIKQQTAKYYASEKPLLDISHNICSYWICYQWSNHSYCLDFQQTRSAGDAVFDFSFDFVSIIGGYIYCLEGRTEAAVEYGARRQESRACAQSWALYQCVSNFSARYIHTRDK